MSLREFVPTRPAGCVLGELPAQGAAVQSAACFAPPFVSPLESAKGTLVLEDDLRARTGYGRVSGCRRRCSVEFTSSSLLDLSNASAAITHARGEGSFLGDLNIATPGGAFTDLIFSLLMAETNEENGPSLTISVFDASTEVGSTSLAGLRHDQEITFALIATSGRLTRVELTSATGIKQARHFDMSGLAATTRHATSKTKIRHLHLAILRSARRLVPDQRRQFF